MDIDHGTSYAAQVGDQQHEGEQSDGSGRPSARCLRGPVLQAFGDNQQVLVGIVHPATNIPEGALALRGRRVGKRTLVGEVIVDNPLAPELLCGVQVAHQATHSS